MRRVVPNLCPKFPLLRPVPRDVDECGRIFPCLCELGVTLLSHCLFLVARNPWARKFL
jgi:hypothetical protein